MVGLLIHLEHHRALRACQLGGAVGDRVQHLLDVECRGERLTDRGERLHLGGALG
jgi:hypothetical protein